MKLEVTTTKYEFAHGKKPRGRGSWVFEFQTELGWSEPWWAPGSLIYSEAKKLAVEEGKARGAFLVNVCS